MTDIQNLFDHKLPTALLTHNEDAKQINARYQFNITGAGSWSVDLTKSGGVKCTPGTQPADCIITISSKDFDYLFEAPKSRATQLFFSGKLKVQGNQMLALKLEQIFNYLQ